jgi:hypothetical protein
MFESPGAAARECASKSKAKYTGTVSYNIGEWKKLESDRKESD